MSSPPGDAQRLAGRCVLVTRPRAQAEALVRQLESAGARVVIAPAIQIVPPVDRAPLLAALSAIRDFDWIVFSSANAVDAVMAAIPEPGSLRGPAVAAVGSRTAELLRTRGVDVAVVPSEFRAEALVDAMTTHSDLTGSRILLPRSEIGRQTIAEGLRASGAIVTDVVAYRTVADTGGAGPEIRAMLARGELDAVTFTSGSAVHSFVQMQGPDVVDLLRNTVVAVIGPVTAAAASEQGIAVQIQPETYTTEAMVEALGHYFR